MPKPQNISAEKYQELRARHTAAKHARQTLELQQAGNMRSSSTFSPALNDALVLELEALIAAESGGAAFNRVAGDLEEIRQFLEAELTAARAVLIQPAPVEPAPLTSASADALRARLDVVIEYRRAHATHVAAVGPAHERISRAYLEARAAQQIVWAQRKAAGLYHPSRATPQGKDLHPTTPSTVAEIDHDLAAIAAQRAVPEHSGAASEAERRLRELRKDRAEYDERVAVEQEVARIDALPPEKKRIEMDRLHWAEQAAR